MKLAIIALTRGGCRTARRYGDLLPEADIYLKREAAEMDPRQQTRRDEHHFECRLAELMAEIYSQYDGFVMIMACHTGAFSRQGAFHDAAGVGIRIGILQGKIPP